MFPYIIFAATPIMFKILLPNDRFSSPETAKKVNLVLFGFVMFAIIALRSEFIGSTDSYGYYKNWIEYSGLNFEQIKASAKESIMEPGYIYSAWFLSRIFSNPQFVFLFSGALFSISVCRFIYKNSEDVTFSSTMFVTLGLYLFMVQGLRQAIAMSIFLFSIEFIKERRFIAFVLIIALASLFHNSVIVCVCLYFLYGLKMKPIAAFIFAGISGILSLSSKSLVAIGNTLFEREYNSNVSTDKGGFIATAIYFIIIIAVILFSRQKKENKTFAFFVYMTALGLVFYLMRYFDAIIVERISFYFMFGQIIVLPSVINCLDPKERQLTKLAVYILSILLFIYRLNGSNLVPYEFFWQ